MDIVNKVFPWMINITAVLGIVYFVIEIFKNFETAKLIIIKIGHFFRYLFDINNLLIRHRYNKVLIDRDYIDWQLKVLKAIYIPIAEEYNKTHEVPAELTACFADNPKVKREYEALLFKARIEYPFPFSSMYSKSDLTYLPTMSKSEQRKDRKKHCSKVQQKLFYNTVASSIRFPNNIGYMLSVIDPDNGFRFKAYTDVYYNNVCTSHFLEYELYRLYKSRYGKKLRRALRDDPENGKGLFTPALLGELKFRNAIHEKCQNNNESVLTSGFGRSSLLSVSMLVACKNHNGHYDILRIRRSENVDAKVGYIQFIPSGGFSALSNDRSFDTQYADFSITKSLFRELIEECFGEDDFSGQVMKSTEEIYSNEIVQRLISDFNDPKNETGMVFLGSVLDLTNLRHELCFLLTIDDDWIYRQIKSNEESSSVVNLISKDVLENAEYWCHFKEKNKNEKDDLMMLNCTSASLWQLAQRSDIYKRL